MKVLTRRQRKQVAANRQKRLQHVADASADEYSDSVASQNGTDNVSGASTNQQSIAQVQANHHGTQAQAIGANHVSGASTSQQSTADAVMVAQQIDGTATPDKNRQRRSASEPPISRSGLSTPHGQRISCRQSLSASVHHTQLSPLRSSVSSSNLAPNHNVHNSGDESGIHIYLLS